MKLALGRALYDPGDPMGKMFFNILATFAESEADLIRMRTREGMAIARARNVAGNWLQPGGQLYLSHQEIARA